MNCPGCDAEQDEAEGTEDDLHVCAECGGLRIGVATLNQLLLHSNLPGIESVGGRKLPEALAVCRRCQVDMTRFEGGSRAEPQFYEVCEECGSTFVAGDSVPSDDPKVAATELVAFFKRFIAKKGKT